MVMHLYRVKTPAGETVLQLSEETAKRDYPSAVRVDGEKKAPKPPNKAGRSPQNKSAN